MKKMILIIALIITGLTVRAQGQQQEQQEKQQKQQKQEQQSQGQQQGQQADVPQEVASALTDKFPNVNMNDVDWKAEAGFHTAKFSMQNKDYEVLFDNQGKWISTDVAKISMNEIPQEVQEGLQQTGYADWKVGDIEKEESQDFTLYKVEVKKGLRGSDVYLDDSGNIVRVDS